MESVIQELQQLRSLPCQLESKEDTICGIRTSSLHQCPVFNKHHDWQKMLEEISDESIAIFQNFLEGRKNGDINDVFEIMAFACKIEWEDFQANCAREARGIKVPDEALSETIISVVGALVRFLPVRTSVQYARLVDKCCRKDNLLKNCLLESMETILHERKNAAYDPLNIPFFEVEATVALMKNIHGQNITAILHNNKWLPVNLFGSKFCPFEARVKQFHLSLGRYVVYQESTGRVLMKDLQSDTQAKIIFETSKFFRSRCNQLHLIFSNFLTGCDELYEWNDQTREFAMLFSNPVVRLKSAHRSDDDRLILKLEFPIYISTKQCIGENDDECLDSWKLNLSQGYFEPPGSKELQGITYIQGKSLYLGYNKLGTHCVHKGVYETIVQYGRQTACSSKYPYRRYSFMHQKSDIHGKVIAFSDLLLF